MDKITSIILAFTLATSLIFYTLWRVEKSKYEASAKQLNGKMEKKLQHIELKK